MDQLFAKKIEIQNDEWGQITALRAHLGVLLETVYRREGEKLIGNQPSDVDSGQILLAAASLRALIFDDTGSPLLLSFLERHQLDVKIDAFDGDFSMLFYAQTKSVEDGHLSQLLLALIAGESEKIEYPIDVQKSLVIIEKNQIPKTLVNKLDQWAPDRDIRYSRAALANDQQVVQFCRVTRRHVPIVEWGGLRMGFLKNIPIKRRSIIEYVANRLGGVHYDSNHHTKNTARLNEFKLLSQAYDWEGQSIMHGAIVASMICSIEIARCQMLVDLYYYLLNAEDRRQLRLLEKTPLY